MSSLPRRTDYNEVVHVVTFIGSNTGWCLEVFGNQHWLKTILRKDEPRWNTPITCLWCVLLDYGTGTPME